MSFNKPLSPYDARILQVLVFAMRPLTTAQISRMGNISYNNTRTRLENLHKKGKIGKRKMANRIYWAI